MPSRAKVKTPIRANGWWKKRPRTMRDWLLASPLQPVGVGGRELDAGAGAGQGVRAGLDRGDGLQASE